MEHIHLPQVTLIGIDCVDVDRLCFATDVSQKFIQFGDVKILTHLPSEKKNIVKIPHLTDIRQYSKFVLRELHQYIETEYALIIQHDGFVLNPFGWTDEFLNYDYIGAPWCYNDNYNVGNGGFSLRSRKLIMEVAKDNTIDEYHPEDHVISRVIAPNLIDKGFKFAPDSLAYRFSCEAMKWKKQFGFHHADISEWRIEEYADAGLHEKYIDSFFKLFPSAKPDNKNGEGNGMASIKKVLVLLYPAIFYIGDNVVLLSKLRLAADFFKDYSIDVNHSDAFPVYRDLLFGNPFVSNISDLHFNRIDFNEYDVILLLHNDEHQFKKAVDAKYNQPAMLCELRPEIYSLYSHFGDKHSVFGTHLKLNEHRSLDQRINTINRELFIEDEEFSYGNDWLQSNGVLPHEKLYVFVDESSSKNKMLRVDVYFDLLDQLLTSNDVRVLIFDHQNLEKKIVYRAWLGEEKTSRIIFATGLSLRETLGIMSSSVIKMIFGPCTGLLHCAVGIRTCLLQKGIQAQALPILVVYTGKYEKEKESVFTWWKDVDINCWIIIRDSDGEKKIMKMNDLSGEEAIKNIEIISCQEYDLTLLTHSLRPLLSNQLIPN